MLDYKLMMQHISEIDTTDYNNIKFTVSIWCTELEEDNKMQCRFVRRADGWNVRAELIIDDYAYHSTVLRHLDDSPLIALHNDLMDYSMRQREDARSNNIAWVDTMQDMMLERAKS